MSVTSEFALSSNVLVRNYSDCKLPLEMASTHSFLRFAAWRKDSGARAIDHSDFRWGPI